MKTKIVTSLVVASLFASTTTLSADTATPKRAIQANYTEVYNTKPKSVESFSDMFQEGEFYGRLRSNTFYWGWEKENASQYNHTTSGLGGSLVYRSASYNGFEFGAGLYYSHGYVNIKDDNVALLKAGADVISRFNYNNTHTQDLATLGQAYVGYSFAKSEINVGRQLVETFYTKSNDSKMAPNTFDGVVVSTKAIPDTAIKLAYLAKEKLRAHSEAHSVLMIGDATTTSSNNASWSENDDSVMHKGLTATALKAAGKSIDAPLIVLDAHNTSVNNLKIDASYYAVPELISEAMVEANYKIAFGKSFSIAPGARYIKQFDNGAGAIGGAAYDGTPTGYKDQNSLNSQMVAAKIVTTYQNLKFNLGFSDVLDEADLISPWRGFPTAGYTRSMARYNWVANTKSYRLELQVNANKTGIYKDLFVQTSVLHTDADEAKGQYDEDYYYLGFVQNIPSMLELQWRLRLGYADTKKTDGDNLDARFELNYLF